MLRSPLVTLEQRVVLTDSEAVSWLSDRGFALVEWNADIRLFADAYRAPDMALARLSRGPSETVHGGSSSSAISFTAVTDGLLELLLPPGETALGRGQAVIALTSQTFRTKSTEQVATIEVELGEAFTERFTPTLLQGPVTIESNRVGIRAISVFVNEILTGVGSLETPLSGGYRRALESLVTDLLEESGRDVMPDIGAADRRLLLRARRLIQAGFADPRFSVARLADELSVSERQLQRAFSTVDSTPHRMLRLTRARAAAELLAAAPGATRADWDRVARRVGLPGARALKDHFRDLGMTAPDRRASS